jgi:hypothetical protein
VIGLDGANFIGQNTVDVAGSEVLTWPISLAIDPYNIKEDVTEFEFKVEVINDPENDVYVQEPSNFLYPNY